MAPPGNASTAASRRRSAVLVVDDYPATLESISRLLRTANHRVYEASTGEDAVRIAIREKPDLALIDYHLPGMNGVEAAAAIRKAGLEIPWVLFSGDVNLSHRATFEAARLGAVNVVSSPFDPRPIVSEMLTEFETGAVSHWNRLREARRLPEPGTTAGLAAWWILVVCASKEDLLTLQAWADYLGVSYTSLRDGFTRLGIKPQDAKALMRVVRALAQVGGRVEHVEGALYLSDPRTANERMDRAGLPRTGAGHPMTFESFLAHQRFVAADHPLLHSLRSLAAQL